MLEVAQQERGVPALGMGAAGGCGIPTDGQGLGVPEERVAFGTLGQRDGLGQLSKTTSVPFSGPFPDTPLHVELVEAGMRIVEDSSCFLSLLPPNQCHETKIIFFYCGCYLKLFPIAVHVEAPDHDTDPGAFLWSCLCIQHRVNQFCVI